MFARTRLRSQLCFGAALLVVVVVVLSGAGINGAMKFRDLTKNIRQRARELPLTAELNRSVADLRVAFSQAFRRMDFLSDRPWPVDDRGWAIGEFVQRVRLARIALADYRDQLASRDAGDPRIADASAEEETAEQLARRLDEIDALISKPELALNDPMTRCDLEETVAELQPLVGQLPNWLKDRMDAFAEQVRAEYHSWILISSVFLGGALGLLVWLIVTFRRSIFQPLEQLVAGARRVASGDYRVRVPHRVKGEVGELVDGFNEMTERFLAIKTDLDEQVRLRTNEVVRREQLASVGFLAAGVAHEINNPLAAIAWSAESLEMRLHEILRTDPERAAADGEGSIEEMKSYLRRIQSEAFRCKEITAGLLDFARLGDARRVPIDLAELLQGVVDMVRSLPRYRDVSIQLEAGRPAVARVQPQALKQVALNLLINALDSLDPGGEVRIHLERDRRGVRIVFADNGCGMSEEVRQHLFEPFFTRRRDGQGTGLGLSISYRIIADHGGSLRAHSLGPGSGSTFTVELPVDEHAHAALQVA